MQTALTQKLSQGTRLGSMLLDHFIMGLAVVVFLMPSAVKSVSDFQNPTNVGSGDFLVYLSYVGFAIYLSKDSILGRSPAKRILNLQVVSNKTGLPASPLQCLLRNFLCYLWPIEVLAALINPERKIGDYLAGTRLTFYDETKAQTKPIIWQIVVAVVIAYIFTYVVMMPFTDLENTLSILY